MSKNIPIILELILEMVFQAPKAGAKQFSNFGVDQHDESEMKSIPNILIGN